MKFSSLSLPTVDLMITGGTSILSILNVCKNIFFFLFPSVPSAVTINWISCFNASLFVTVFVFIFLCCS